MATATAKTTKYPNLASALAAFQADIPTPAKDSSATIPSAKGAGYKYDYASLDKITPLILGKLAEVGIAYTAAPDLTEIGFGLRAKLVHESGDEFGGFYPLGNPNNPAQAIGAAITYARRYALLALTGVAPGGEDDDGASATEAQAKAPEVQSAAPKKATAASVKAEIKAIIDGSEGLLDGADANSILSKLTNDKPSNEWTVDDLTAGKAKLVELLEKKRAEA